MLDCEECENYLLTNFWSIKGACASVGIEHGKTTEEMVRTYMVGYHVKGHTVSP